jgi:anthranilate phosphoribosyltransferase
MTAILQRTIENLGRGDELAASDAEAVLDALITEADESMIARVLTAWHRKGIEANEIYEFARIMRARMNRVKSRHDRIADIVGTGGSKAKTFNVSTAASFVVAGAGLPVAKHGNKAATSSSGSADVLSELGINPAVDPQTAERCLNEIGICFMFAPNYHRLSPTLAKVRRGLGFPTIFNCVGPLCNPASATHQLIGVWDDGLVPKMAEALTRLGARRSWVVYGENGLDEIAISGETIVAEVDGGVRMLEIDPEFFGMERCSSSQLRSDDPAHSAQMIGDVLLGRPHDEAAERIVLLNAAATLLLAGVAATPQEAAALARESLNSGRAHGKLKELAELIPV